MDAMQYAQNLEAMSGQMPPAPVLKFEYRNIEDPTVLLAEGVRGVKQILFVVVTPIGSRDSHEVEWDSFRADKLRDKQQGRLPLGWMEVFEAAHKAFIDGEKEEVHVEGTRLSAWPAMDKATIVNCQRLGIYSVEQLANAPEDAIGRIGMRGMQLRNLAKEFLNLRSDTKHAALIQQLQLELAAEKEKSAKLETANESLRKQLTEQLATV